MWKCKINVLCNLHKIFKNVNDSLTYLSSPSLQQTDPSDGFFLGRIVDGMYLQLNIKFQN